MQVLESDLEALQNDFNSLSEDVEKLVVNLETIVEKLGNVEVELKATNRKILILSVLSAVGIVAAVVLAILL